MSFAELNVKLGERLRMLVGKPGLDGHSNGAEQVAVRIIPPQDAEALRAHGVAHVFTPKDFELTEIMNQIRPRR